MQLKTYQTATLNALDRFLTHAAASGPAEAFAREVARQDEDARLAGIVPVARRYVPLQALPDVPYVCLRLPTGGGKTLLAAEAIRLAGRAYLRRAHPLTLWFVPSDAIKTQTLEALADPTHPYRRRLDEVFGGRVRVFDIAAFDTIRPQDIAGSACVVVSTIQAFRVSNTTGRRVYGHNEELEAHFAGVATAGMEVVSAQEASATKGHGLLTEGAVKFSFANLLFHHRPLMIVDEAHNAVSGLTREMQARIRPAAILEFTATPKGVSNILHSVTASALKDEEMIKLPIRVRPHSDWRAAVSATVATRHMLEGKAAGEDRHLRPVALYQAQAKNGHPTVEELRRYLIEEKLVPEARIKVATGEQRELDGVDLRDPAEETRHVITVAALKEGWDCPSAYVLCATQRLSSSTAVEQLLGRVLRMPFAARRADEALNASYAHVSEPSFQEAAEALRDKLIDMGFTDEEVRASLKPPAVEVDAQGTLFDPDPVRPQPVVQFDVEDTEATRTALAGWQEAGVEYVARDGRLTVGMRGAVPEEVVTAATALAPEAARAGIDVAVAKHRAAVEARRSLAEKGASIEVPLLLAAMDGEVFVADADAVLERTDWSLTRHPARLSEEEFAFRRNEELVEIDLDGDKLIYRRENREQAVLPGLGTVPDGDLEAGFVRWLERECRVADIPSSELQTWLAGVVADLLGRGIGIRTLIDWQHALAARLRRKIAEIRGLERRQAWQANLFDGPPVDGADAPVIRFDAAVYPDVPTRPTGSLRLTRHLLGHDRAPLTDGDISGEEFQCALALDGLEAVDVWVRNVARHRDSFWLPRPNGNRFYPDFLAKLTDGRVIVVEYKGAHIVGAPEAREKDLVGRLWAARTGHLFLMVTRDAQGQGPSDQIRTAVARG